MDYTEILNALLPLVLSAAGIVLTGVGTYLAMQVKKFLDTREKRAIAETTVAYVEQIGKLLGSEEKFDLALETITQELNNAGINFTEVELKVLIEAAVNGFKKEYSVFDEKPIEDVVAKSVLEEPVGSE